MTPQVISLSSAGSTAWIPVDYIQNPYYISLALVFSNTPNLTCKVEYTLDNVFDTLVTPTAFAHTSLTNITTNTTGSITYPIRAFRLTVTAWTSGTVTLTALQGVTNPQIYTTTGSGSLIYRFPSWPANTGYLLASLVASSTASRTAGVVTVTATGHGVTTGTTYVGFRFYYPGSPSLVAGWYDSISTIPDANTITFSSNGPDFASESINSGSAWTTNTDVTSVIIPGGTLRDQSKVSVYVLRSGDNTSTTKALYIYFGGTYTSYWGAFSLAVGGGKLGFSCLGNDAIRGLAAVEGGLTATAINSLTKNLLSDQTLLLRGALSAASAFLVLYGANLEITQ
jgi:hypothetical protein